MHFANVILCRVTMLLCFVASPVLHASDDPLQSPMWDYLRNVFLGDTPYQFDDRIVVSVPPLLKIQRKCR